MIAKEGLEAGTLEQQLRQAQEELAELRAEVEKLKAQRPPDLQKLQKDIKRHWLRFITDKVNPGHEKRHHGDLSSWGPALWKEAGQLGVIGVGAPKAVGGDGLDPLSTGIVLEELGKLCEDPGFLMIAIITKKCANILAATGREDLVEQFARPMIKGEQVAAWASWEPGDTGSLKATAKKVEDGWVLNGTKPFVTGGLYATSFAVLFSEEESHEPILFMVRKDDPGVQLTPFTTVGARHAGFAALSLENVKVPAARMVIDQDAMAAVTSAFDEEVWNLSAIHLGWMERMFHLCIDDLEPKVRGGMAFLDLPHVQSEIGRLHIGIETARSLFLRTLERYREGKNDPMSEPMTVMLKYYVSERTVDTARSLMQLQGGAAYLDDNPWGRYLSHVLCLFHAAGTQDLMPRQLGEGYLRELAMARFKKKFTM